MDFLLAMLGGACIGIPLYLFVFGGLERLIKRDEGKEPPANSFKAANDRVRKSDRENPR